METGSGSWS